MEESKSMKIIETCIVKPLGSPSQFSLPLTFLDKIWLPLDPSSRVFFYEFSKPETDFSKKLLPQLKNSLSLTLNHYLPLAGYLMWHHTNQQVIHYSPGDGLSLTIAETQADFYSISGDDFRESVDLRSLLPEFPTWETRSPCLTLKITLFEDSGFSIAYVAHHAVLDGQSISLFLHSWAYICKNKGDHTDLPLELIPIFDRTFVKQQSELKQTYPKILGLPPDLESKALTIYDMNPPMDTVVGTFKLTRENIETLKNKLESGTRISTYTVVCAYTMVCLIKAREIKSEKTFIGINIDGRARLDPKLPSTYFGNCVLACGNGGDTEIFLSENGFPIAVEVVSEALNSINEGVLRLGEKLYNLLYCLFRDYTGFVVAGSPRFELYRVDFGWGRPRKVEMVSIDKSGAFCLTDDRDGKGGIEIGVGMKKHQAKAFSSIFANGFVAY